MSVSVCVYVQDPSADDQPPCERRLSSPFEGPLVPLEQKYISFNIIKSRTLSASVRHNSPSWNMYGLRLVNVEEVGLWSVFFFLADTEDLKTMPPSEIHVKRFKSKEVDNQKKRQCICIYMQDWRNIAGRAVVIHRGVQSVSDFFR